MNGNPDLSIVVPLYNEEGSITALYGALTSVLTSMGLTYEIILVDDGSTDGTPEQAEIIASQDDRVRIITLSRNFGHMTALTAGLDHAIGRAVITMDGDLQHPPELLPVLVERWQDGAEVVNTIRQERLPLFSFKRFSAVLFYRLFSWMGGIRMPPNAADFRLLDRKVVDALKTLRERGRFIRGLVSWVGFRQDFVAYEPQRRGTGRSKYPLKRMLSFAVDGIVSFSSLPLRAAVYLGLAVAGISFLDLLYALYIRLFTDRAVEGWTSLLVAVLFLGGVQLIFLGVIGEYLSRIYEETKQRPLYIIKKRKGFPERN
ncbi:MAG: glycosyltransferase family 2 protein [Syntrophales bacterium]|nr:glycosyltransferase family 2 protein [Syntrophales bacterium]